MDLNSAFSLTGRTAVVTGAGSGIGRATALVLGAAGARVVVADRDLAGLEETAALLEDAVTVPTDVTDHAAVDDLARAAVKATGKLNVWANVAGILRPGTVLETSPADLEALLAVNFTGTLWGTSAAGRAMSATGGGSIINISSTGSEAPTPGLAVYGMTKAAVNHLTRTAAVELGPAGVRVNAIAPGWVDTPMTQGAWTEADGSVDEAIRNAHVAGISSRSPLGATGTPDDIAWAVLYLAADASRFVTGQLLRVNGGVYLG